MTLELGSLKKAIDSLESTISLTQKNDFLKFSEIMQQAIIAEVIQNFEFTYELCWKFMKRYLSNQLGSSVVDGVSRMELFRLSREHHLIEDVIKWKMYHDYRNLTSHTYDEKTAAEVFNAAVFFLVMQENFSTN